MSVLNVPRPGWASEDTDLLAHSADRFFERECVPRYHEWEAQGSVGRDIWLKAGSAGLLCASVPETYGGAEGTFAHEAVIAHGAVYNGAPGFGLALHNAIVAP